MKQVHRILHIGKSSISGITYPREELEQAIVRLKEKTTPTIAFLLNKESPYFDLEYAIGQVEDIFLDDEGLVTIIDMFEPETDAQRLLRDLMSAESMIPRIKVSPVFIGKVENIDGEKIASRLSLDAVQFSLIEDGLTEDK